MSMEPDPADAPARLAAHLRRLSADYAATPLVELPRLAARLGVGQVLVKDEGRRALGSFKSLGGTYAGLRALARAAGTDVPGLAAAPRAGLPVLLCASDGNHGLAVAYAAHLAGARARVFLHAEVARTRAERIAALGARIARVEGTYDAAVAAATAAAQAGEGILVADTGDDPGDTVVRDVMRGYALIAHEIRRQLGDAGHAAPTHVFVQAGVGGLAAALADGLGDRLADPGVLAVVEPEAAACVAAALAAGAPVQIGGTLQTAAAMLSCGRASAAALAVLGRHAVHPLQVGETALEAAPRLLADAGGPVSTPSGAAGLAGLGAALADPRTARELRLGGDSRVLLIVSEGDLETPAR